MKINNLNNENRKEKYAKLWEKDSSEMNENKLYDWMSNKVKKYKNILEIGCGAGYSTLNLLKKHSVICIESNKYCINIAKKLLKDNGYKNIEIINERISENNCVDIARKINKNIDLVICWNPGSIDTLSDEEIRIKNLEFYEMGYPPAKDLELFAHYYAEDIIRSACKIGEELNVDVHIIDRDVNKKGKISDYINIKEYGFKKVKTKRKKGKGNENTMKNYKKIFYKSFLLVR